MITQTSLNNAKFLKRIKRQLWLCKLESMTTHKRATTYVKNRKGNNCLRLDVHRDGSLSAYAAGCGNKDIAKIILKALDNN